MNTYYHKLELKAVMVTDDEQVGKNMESLGWKRIPRKEYRKIKREKQHVSDGSITKTEREA